jgi:hypothetical protein
MTTHRRAESRHDRLAMTTLRMRIARARREARAKRRAA